MSNHPSNTIKSRLLRRGLAGILSLALLLSLIPSTVLTARAAGWEDQYIQTLVDWGVMRGDVGGNMAPTRSITRAEFVTMMNRAYGYKQLGGHPFTDVRNRDWYAQDIDIAYNIGYFKGTGPTTASPNATLTREQAAVLLARNMMLQETVGETLGFSDSRSLSDWSRGLIGAAAENGIISGYDDGSFQPFRNITRGEVAAMLVRAIGTPIQTPGDHALGNVYGNVTVNTAGVKLRDGVIAGNLYLTGGIDLGDVLLENITVLGEIIISGGGESNSSESSVILRNVVADSMVVDSIGDQFVTIRTEGITDIPTTTVRTNAYVDDSALPGYGLSFIELDGEEGALYQLAGNIKDVINKTPGSDMQIVQGTAEKVTVDEKATGSAVLVDGDAQVGDLNLDTATDVTGTGDIKNLNVGAAGSTVEQLPDNIVIRPGINADIGGSSMNSTQAAESSADPKLLAGYPAVRKIAPQSAELLFRVNKPGTIYWAVSSVSDGSVSEADLMDPPTYGNRVLASGTVTATAANTDYTATVNRLTSGGSYYVTAMLVDGRDEHSPIKVTSFTTPDDSVPAFADGYPVMSLVSTEIAQVTVMTTKSCLLYYALLPRGAKAPTEAEFKSAAIPGNLGYGSQSVTKNVTIPINVNNVALDEKTEYVLYLWLVDHDGAQKSAVVPVRFTTPDETPPVVTYAKQLFSNSTPGLNSIQVEYTIDEPADFVWAIVTEGDHMRKNFLTWTGESQEPGDSDRSTLRFATEADLLAAKVQLASGTGALLSGTTNRSPASIQDAKLLFENAKTSSFVLYYMADDNATNTGNLSAEIKALRVRTKDETPPDVSLRFNSDGAEVEKDPQADADVRILFTEQVKGTNTKDKDILLDLYQAVLDAEDELEDATDQETITRVNNKINAAKNTMAKALDTYIELHQAVFPATNKLTPLDENATPPVTGSWINWRNAKITMPDDGSGNVEILLPGVRADESGAIDRAGAAIQLEGGVTYYFRFRDIFDLAYPTGNALVQGDNDPCYRQFTTSFAKVNLEETEVLKMARDDVDPSLVNDLFPGTTTNNDPARIDLSFTAKPTTVDQVGDAYYWDMLLWSDTSLTFTLYARQLTDKDGNAVTDNKWKKMGQTSIVVPSSSDMVYTSLYRVLKYGSTPNEMPAYDKLNQLGDWEYGIHVDRMLGTNDATSWPHTLNMRVSVVAGTQNRLNTYVGSGRQSEYDRALQEGVTSIGVDDPFTMRKPFEVRGIPEIQTGYPAMTALNDTTAEITVRLGGRSGYVHYLVLPMTKMYQVDGTEIDKSFGTISETVAATITNYEMYYKPNQKDTNTLVTPSMLTLIPSGGITGSAVDPVIVGGEQPVTGDSNRPDLDDLVKHNVEGYPRGQMPAASAADPDSPIRIPLENLDPNTIYYVFLVTESGTSSQFSDVFCYRFTTKPAQRPTIQVRGTGSTVNVYVSKDVSLDYWLAPNGNEGGGGPNDQFQIAFSDCVDTDRFTWYAAGATGWSASNNSYSYTYEGKRYFFSYSREGYDLSTMTVIDAMATGIYNGPDGRDDQYEGSVFDFFAKSTEKQKYAGLIQQSTSGGASYRFLAGTTGHEECKPPFSTPNPIYFDLTPNNIPKGSYTFVSVGTSTQDSGYAFRAFYSLTKRDSGIPVITSANGNALKMNTTAAGDRVTGTVDLRFRYDLYYSSGRDYSSRVPVCSCAQEITTDHPTDKSTYPLGPIVPATSTDATEGITVITNSTEHSSARVSRVQLSLNYLQLNKSYPCDFNEGLCGEGGDGMYDRLTLDIMVKQDDNGNLYAEVTIPEAWEGRPVNQRPTN